MITIKICEYEQQFNRVKDIDEQWINQQINRRRESGEAVWVRVTIQQGILNMSLATPNCQGSGGGSGRPPNQQEHAVYNLWNKRGLDEPNFTGGNLIAFLKQFVSIFTRKCSRDRQPLCAGESSATMYHLSGDVQKNRENC